MPVTAAGAGAGAAPEGDTAEAAAAAVPPTGDDEPSEAGGGGGIRPPLPQVNSGGGCLPAALEYKP